MIERYSPNTVTNVRPGTENVVPGRQVPSGNPSLTDNNDGVPSYLQTINLRARVNDQPWITGLEVQNCGYVAPAPCTGCEWSI